MSDCDTSKAVFREQLGGGLQKQLDRLEKKSECGQVHQSRQALQGFGTAPAAGKGGGSGFGGGFNDEAERAKYSALKGDIFKFQLASPLGPLTFSRLFP